MPIVLISESNLLSKYAGAPSLSQRRMDHSPVPTTASEISEMSGQHSMTGTSVLQSEERQTGLGTSIWTPISLPFFNRNG